MADRELFHDVRSPVSVELVEVPVHHQDNAQMSPPVMVVATPMSASAATIPETQQSAQEVHAAASKRMERKKGIEPSALTLAR
jgi:hypothetical protein